MEGAVSISGCRDVHVGTRGIILTAGCGGDFRLALGKGLEDDGRGDVILPPVMGVGPQFERWG